MSELNIKVGVWTHSVLAQIRIAMHRLTAPVTDGGDGDTGETQANGKADESI